LKRNKLTFRSLSLWHTGKKKPIFTQAFAHGIDETPRWITSIAHLRGSDLFVSGKLVVPASSEDDS